jgi:hypothetical protein
MILICTRRRLNMIYARVALQVNLDKMLEPRKETFAA